MSDFADKIREFFTVDPKNSKTFKCNLCATSHKGIKGGFCNLKDHLISRHKSTADGLQLDSKRKRRNTDHSTDKRIVKTVKLQVNINNLRCGLVLFVIGKCLSFRSMDDAGFKLAFGPLFSALDETINRTEIRKMILYAAQQVRQIIAQKLKGKMISLMFDGAKRHNRSVFGVKAQYIDDKDIKVIGLGALTMCGRQNSEAFKLELVEVLKSFGKSVDDVYATVSDTAAVMLKSSRMLKEAQEHFYTFEMFLDEDEDGDFNDISNSLDLVDNNFSDHNVSSDDGDLISGGTIQQISCEDLGTIGSVIHCGAHKCQLAASDVSKKFTEDFVEVRAFVKECKKTEHSDMFRKAKITLPVLDNEPRWDTKYLMCKSICDQKASLSNLTHRKLQLSDETWEFIENFVATFQPIHAAMKIFQFKALTMGELLFTNFPDEKIIKVCFNFCIR